MITNETGSAAVAGELWRAADTARGHMDLAEFRHVLLGLVFLRQVGSEALQVSAPWSVPPEARWSAIAAAAGQPDVGLRLNAAAAALERANPGLAGALPQEYARPGLDDRRLAALIALVARVDESAPAGAASPAGIYSDLLERFARAEGPRSDFHTPGAVTRVMVEMLAPRDGALYDPCCGDAATLLQAAHFSRVRGQGPVVLYGQEVMHSTWRLARMNVALRGPTAKLAQGDSLRNDAFPDLRAESVFAAPPFNAPEWGAEALRADPRWRHGMPPATNANFAWLQHALHHLTPTGQAAVLLSNGSLASAHAGEARVRRALVEAGALACIVALPGQLLTYTSIPACVWVLRSAAPAADGPREVLFIDARAFGTKPPRLPRTLSDAEVGRIAATYRAWRARSAGVPGYEDTAGFCRTVTLAEIARQDFSLPPSRYVGAAAEAPAEPFDVQAQRLIAELDACATEAERLDRLIRDDLAALGLRGRDELDGGR